MSYRELEAAWAYHEGTKHSPYSIRASRHFLDWENHPLPYKIYLDLEPIPLLRELGPSAIPALSVLRGEVVERPEECVPELPIISRLLYYSGGVTKRVSYPQGDKLFRAASCTGALYHVDSYLVCGDLPQLEAGVYHFGVHDFALRRLRRGDFRGELLAATAGETAVAHAPAVLVCTSTFWRNAWKYQARTYRHCFWDAGMILANLLGIAAAHYVPARVVCGFVDTRVNRLLGLDPRREVSLALVSLGRTERRIPPPPEVRPLALKTERLSQSEVDYPAIRAMHEASLLPEEPEVAAWRGAVSLAHPPSSGQVFALPVLGSAELPPESIEEVILRRASTRRFARRPVGLGQLATILETSSRPVAADFTATGEPLSDQYLIVNAVEGLPSGSHLCRSDQGALELLKEGDFRETAGYLGLEQELSADASADIFFLTDLRPILQRFGNRGYRAAQLEAAIRAGRIYLTAFALRLGATGLTFYDDDVTEFFSPSAAGNSVMFLVAVGRSARRPTRE